MVKLLIIIPYFGRWPFWFDCFIESCRWNKKIDWLLYSDCGVPPNLPNNVQIQEISFAAYKQLVSAKLDICFNPENPYKLCDIKPALGYIHREELEGYDFWAFGDVDVVYGDLMKQYAPLLRKYDCISTHARRISGHFCILKNRTEILTVFKKVKGWQQILSDPDHRRFDEKHFSRLFVKHKNFPEWFRTSLDKLSALRRKSYFREDFTTPNCRHAWHDGSYNFPDGWYWQGGKLTNNLDGDKQYPYLHFFFWKGWVWPLIQAPRNVYNLNADDLKTGWVVSESGFHSLPK